MINWEHAKKGATVKFRCGGSATLSHDSVFAKEYPIYHVFLKEYGKGRYISNGYFYGGDYNTSALDIVEIIPPPEPKRMERYFNLYLSDKGEQTFGFLFSRIDLAKEAADLDENFYSTVRITCTDDPKNPDPTIEVVR